MPEQMTFFEATPRIERRPEPQTEEELYVRALALESRTMAQLAECMHYTLPVQLKHAKGSMGQLIEALLGSNPNAYDQPDFTNLGIELKTIPVTPQLTPLESTFCCSINMQTSHQSHWSTSRLRCKLKHVLWVPILGQRDEPMDTRIIGRAILWRPSMHEEATLKQDWEDLMGAIGAGQAYQLTAHKGVALQVRPKAAHANVRRISPTAEGSSLELPLGFYLRPSFTQRILQDAYHA